MSDTYDLRDGMTEIEAERIARDEHESTDPTAPAPMIDPSDQALIDNITHAGIDQGKRPDKGTNERLVKTRRALTTRLQARPDPATVEISREDGAAIGRLLKISQIAQGILFAHGQIDPGSDIYADLVAELDAETLVDDWERAKRLAALSEPAQQEVTGE